MARTNNRDVTLTLSIDALGEENIKRLEESIRALAAEGGKAGPEFAALADEVGRLGESRAALDNFRQLSDTTAQLAQAQQKASDDLAQMRSRLSELATAAETAGARQREAVQDVVAGQKAYNDATAAIKALRTEYDAAGRKTEEYSSKLKSLLAVQLEKQNALVDLRVAQRAANKELTEAEQSETKLAKQVAAREAALRTLNAEVEKNQRQTLQAAQAVDALGLSTTDLVQAESQLLAAYNQTGAAAAEAKRRADEYAAGMAEVIAEAEKLEAVLQQAALDKAAADQRALADAAGLLATEQQLAAEAAARQDAAMREAAASAQALAKAQADLDAAQWVIAQEDLTRALEAQAREARDLIAAEQRLAEEQKAAAQAAAQAKTEMAAAAEVAAARVDAAFKTVGLRSVEAIRKEIDDVKAAMVTAGEQAQRTGVRLDGAFTAGAARIRELEREIREVTGSLTFADRAADVFKNSIGQITAGNLVADAIGALVERVKDLGRQFVTTIVETEQLRRGLMTIYRDATVVAQQFNFLRQTALSAGVSVGSLQQNFVRFSASLNSAGVPLAEANALFAATARAAGSLGLSGEQVSGMLEALGQIASKGTVSLEELRQQLGDRLPGAIGLTAKGLGVTESELIKLVESGQLASRDFFPAFTQSLRALEGEVTGLRPGFENLKTSLTSLAQESGDAFWTQALTGGLKLLTAAVGIVGGALLGFTNQLKIAGAFWVSLLSPLDSLRDGFGFLRQEIDAAADRQIRFSEAIDNALNPTAKAAEETQKLAEQSRNLGSSTQQAAGSYVALTTQVGTTKAGVEALAIAQASAAKAAETQRSSYVGLTVELNKLLAGLENEQVALDKQAKAVDTSGKALVELAKLRGNEIEALEVGAKAADDNVKALESLAKARQGEVEVLTVQLGALERDRLARGDTKEQIEKETGALREKLATAGAEAEQSAASVRQAEAEAFARRLAVQAAKDNSAAVEELTKAQDEAQRMLLLVKTAYEGGTVSAEQYKKATQKVAEAEYLLRDAIRDRLALQQSTNTLKQAEITLMTAGLRVREDEIKAQIESAKKSGDVEKAVRLEIEAKKVQIQIIELSAKAKKLEAEATIAAVEGEREQLRQSGLLTAAKDKELQARILNARAKEKEAEAAGIAVRGLREEITELQNKSLAVSNYAMSLSTATTETERLASNTGRARSELNGLALSADRVAQSVERMTLAQRNATVNPSTSIDSRFSESEGFLRTTRTVSTGQAVNKPTQGEWTYVPYYFDIPGLDSRGNPVPGGWKYLGPGAQPMSGPRASGGTSTGAAAPTGATAGGSAPAAVTPRAPQVVEIRFRRPDGSAISVTADSQAQAEELIRLLEEEYRLQGGA